MQGTARPRSLGAAAAVLAALCAGSATLAAAAGAEPPIGQPLAVLPSIDLAWGKADRQAVDNRLYRALAARGFDLVPEPALLDFLTRHRLRYTGDVTQEQRERLAEELGARSVLLTSIDAFEAEAPPRVALNARIVALPAGTIVWADEVALAGEQHQGALGRGEIQDIDALLDRALIELLSRLEPDARTQASWHHARGRSEHRPKRVFRAPEFDALRERPARVCVLPFENQSPNPDAGDVLSGLFVTHLAGRERFELVPPGDVRAAMLEGRVIQLEGLSLAQADFLREALDADLAVTGRVLEYADHGAGTEPRVSFSVWVIDLRRRSVVWSGHSASRGDDGVVFFDVGRVRSARSLAGAMVTSAADALASGKPVSGGSKDGQR